MPAILRLAVLLFGLAAIGAAVAAGPEPAAASAAASPPALQPPPAGTERISHGRFDELFAYRPQGTPTSFVLFLSGEAGWDAAADAMARALVQKGALVTAISTPQLFAVLEKDGGDCAYTVGDLENLSHFVQAYYRLPGYFPPILVGYSAGAFAYANLAQATADKFGGALLLGFSAELKLKKPLCKGNGLESEHAADNNSSVLLPPKALPAPLTALQGESDTVASPEAVRTFFAQSPGARVVTMPRVGHGFGASADWVEQFQQAYSALADTVKPHELAAPPASLNGLPVIEVPAQAGQPESDVFALLISGDGGWAGLDQEVAGALTARGIPVVGLDSLRYFWAARTPDSTAADTDRILRYYLAQWHKQRVLLVGYSQGADVLPFIINRLPAATREKVAVGVVMGLSAHAVFEFHMGNWVSDVSSSGLPTLPEMQRAGDTPLLCIYGTGETDTLCPQLDPTRVHVVQLPGGHHFNGDYQRLAQEILVAANLAPAVQPVTAASGQSLDNVPGKLQMLTMHIALAPLLSLVAGLLILVQPRLLNYIVAIYLIAVGIIGLLHY